MAMAADRCIGRERPQAECSKVAIARETTMAGRSPGDACGSLLNRPRFRLATQAALFSAIVPFARPSLADNHQDAIGLGNLGASVTVTRAEDGAYFITSYSKVTSISKSPDGNPQGAVTEDGTRYNLAMNEEAAWVATLEAFSSTVARLGTSEDSVVIVRADDGRYRIDGVPIRDGERQRAGSGKT